MSYEYFAELGLADDQEFIRLIEACAAAAGLLVLRTTGNRCELRWKETSFSAGDDYDVCVFREPTGVLASFHSFQWDQRKRLLAELERAFSEASGHPVVFEET